MQVSKENIEALHVVCDNEKLVSENVHRVRGKGVVVVVVVLVEVDMIIVGIIFGLAEAIGASVLVFVVVVKVDVAHSTRALPSHTGPV